MIFFRACDGKDPPMYSNEHNNHILISRRKTDDIFEYYYSRLFNIYFKACVARLPEQIRGNVFWGCISEMLLEWVLDDEDLEVEKVSQASVKFQRFLNVNLPDGWNQQLFNKFSQSHNQP